MPINSECINVASKRTLGEGDISNTVWNCVCLHRVAAVHSLLHHLFASLFAFLCLGTFVWRQHQNKQAKDREQHKHNWWVTLAQESDVLINCCCCGHWGGHTLCSHRLTSGQTTWPKADWGRLSWRLFSLVISHLFARLHLPAHSQSINLSRLVYRVVRSVCPSANIK